MSSISLSLFLSLSPFCSRGRDHRGTPHARDRCCSLHPFSPLPSSSSSSNLAPPLSPPPCGLSPGPRRRGNGESATCKVLCEAGALLPLVARVHRAVSVRAFRHGVVSEELHHADRLTVVDVDCLVGTYLQYSGRSTVAPVPKTRIKKSCIVCPHLSDVVGERDHLG